MNHRLAALSLSFLFLLATGLMGCKPQAHSASEIVIGVQPNEKDRGLDSLGEELSRRTGLKVSIFAPKDYADLVQRFRDGQVNFAFFSPLTFIQAEQEAGAKALLKKVYGKSEFYYSAVVVRADSSFRKAQDLKGKRFGFVDPKSTSGFLYPRVLLRKAGFDPLEGPHEFLGTHQGAVQALLDKKVDAVGVWADDPALGTGAWNDEPFAKVPKGTFRVVTVSEPIPNDAFAVRDKYYQENPLVVFKVMEAMISMGEDGDKKILKQIFNVDRMATATSRHYDSVRALQALLNESKK
ncbi:MAG: phosphate/phosphite/phosphonate ABC transporter substrate-binding protein [Bdellovibrionales bacterium]|nr:phosphate/phosphite/phosphonate ABC transporter substrate-binding protein [Bdellovibrionales bacterium]